MPKTILKSPTLAGGLSTQPDHVRFPNQVEEALNAAFSVYDGASKRPGTHHLAAFSDMAATGSYRMAGIVRNAGKEFLAIFGSSPKVRILRVIDGVEMPVTITAAADAYLGDQGATAADLRLLAITDDSLILNTRVPTKGKKSDAFTVDNTYADYDAMVAASPAAGTHNKTTGDSPHQARGYWLVGSAVVGTTVPEWVGPNVSGSNSISYWVNGHKFTFSRGDIFYSRAFRMTVNDGATNRTFEYRYARGSGAANMTAVAQHLTASQSPAPLTGEKINIVWSSGKFAIQLPFGWTFVGMDAGYSHANGFNAINIGSTAYYNENQTGAPFRFVSGTVGTTVVGEYGDKTYTRLPPPDQENAVIDATTMPVKLARNADDSFTCDLATWGFRGTGDNLTNPLPSIIKKNLPISDIATHRDRLVFSGSEHLVFSRVSNFYDLFLKDDRNIVESDPIDVQISGTRVSKIRHIVPFGKRLVLNTEANQQFELTDAEKLTYQTVAITPSTQIESMAVRPLAIGLSLFIAGKTADTRQMLEYVYDDIRQGSDATDTGEHVKGIIPDDLRAMVGSGNARVVLAVQGDGPRILAYSFYWNGNQKQQSAWGVWELEGDADIHDAVGIGTNAYLLVARGEQMAVERLPMAAFTVAGENPIHLDRQVEQVDGGTYTNDGYTTWTMPAADGGWDTAVLVGSEWGRDEGKVLPLQRIVADEDDKVRTFGKFTVTGGTVVFGQAFPFRLKMSRPYRRDQQGSAILGEKLTAMRWVVEVRRTQDATLQSVDESTSKLSREVHFEKESPSDARIQAWFGGDVDRMKLVIRSDGPKPATITGWELEAMTGRR